MTPEDAFNMKPAVHPCKGGHNKVNCTERQDSPCLNLDHAITSRSKTTRRKELGDGDGMWAPSSQLDAVSHLSEIHHTHPSDA